MTDVFISYAREDQDRVRPAVESLRACGLAVFWDENLTTGAPWREQLEARLAQARVVVVLWSRAAKDSPNVNDEADRALKAGKLISLKLDPDVEPSLGHGQLHIKSFQSVQDAAWRDTVAEIIWRVQGASAPPATPGRTARQNPSGKLMALVGPGWGIAGILLFTAAVLGLGSQVVGLRLRDMPLLRHVFSMDAVERTVKPTDASADKSNSSKQIPKSAIGIATQRAAPRQFAPPTRPDPASEAGRLWEPAGSGDPVAMTALGFLYANGNGGVEVNDREANRLFEAAARQGHAPAARLLGDLYMKGRGNTQDPDLAIAERWFRSAADITRRDDSSRDAMNDLGVIYYKRGEASGQDDAVRANEYFKEAIKWFRGAADRHAPIAMFNLGVLHEEGKGVGRDIGEALLWYRTAARKADEVGDNRTLPRANLAIGRFHEEGRLEKANARLAVHHYQIAANANHPEGMYRLGQLYAKGADGLPADAEKSAGWFFDAFSKGDAILLERLKLVEKGKKDVGRLPAPVQAGILRRLKDAGLYSGNVRDPIGPEAILAIDQLVSEAKRNKVKKGCIECH